jgi:aspartyl-tRNA(Asn)/glutamyl-tRNA(Gln) amidotransferase subunit C
MVDVNRETIHYLSDLSRIACNEEEEKGLLGDLKEILAYIEQLNELDTDGVTPCFTVLEQLTQTPLRDDVAKTTLSQKTFLDGAPQKTASFVRVPTVLKNKEEG